MKIKKILTSAIIAGLLTLTITSCGSSEENTDFSTKEVKFYREKDDNNNLIVNRNVDLRYYDKTPNVPFMGVNEFYNEFYNTNLDVKKEDSVFTFTNNITNSYIKVDTLNDVLSVYDIDGFSEHPEFIDSNSTIFLKEPTVTKTPLSPKIIDLSSYSIDAYRSKSDAYLPLSLISNLVTGTSLYSIVYNEEALFEFDYKDRLGKVKGTEAKSRMEDFYGDTYKNIFKSDSNRSDDMINFSYNLICLLIDNFRGYTTQMKFIDNNIVSLGLNGTLEKYHPQIKKLLLSNNRKEYTAGFIGLFGGLSDGGHTAYPIKLIGEITSEDQKRVVDYYEGEEQQFLQNSQIGLITRSSVQGYVMRSRKSSIGFDSDDTFYYYNDDQNDLAYLGFNTFVVDYAGWDQYYKDKASGKTGTIPTNDSYARVREGLYQALEDGVSDLVIDMAGNGGGDSAALAGILGLLNGAKATISFNVISNHYRIDKNFLVDINLDGLYDENDINEANKFKDLNIVIMTSDYSFSCGNLLPSLLVELGYKTIGQKSGGGSCAIMMGSSGDGIYYIRSSYKCLSDASGNNIDNGVNVDVELLSNPQVVPGIGIFYSYDKFYDFAEVKNVINSLKQ